MSSKDIDPIETSEWLEAINSVIEEEGIERASYLLTKIAERLNQEGAMIILTTHYLEQAEKMCDRIGILNKGNLVALDTTQKLLEKIQIKKISIKVHKRVNINESKFKTLKIVSSTNNEINLSYDKNELKIDQIIKLIEENGARIIDLSTDDGDLEDVFLSLTKS